MSSQRSKWQSATFIAWLYVNQRHVFKKARQIFVKVFKYEENKKMNRQGHEWENSKGLTWYCLK